VIVGQLLHQHGIADEDLQDAAPQAVDTRLGGELGTDRLVPRLFEVQLSLAPPPTAGGEQAAQDLAERFGTAFARHGTTPSMPLAVSRTWPRNRKRLSITTTASPDTDNPARS